MKLKTKNKNKNQTLRKFLITKIGLKYLLKNKEVI